MAAVAEGATKRPMKSASAERVCISASRLVR